MVLFLADASACIQHDLFYPFDIAFFFLNEEYDLFLRSGKTAHSQNDDIALLHTCGYNSYGAAIVTWCVCVRVCVCVCVYARVAQMITLTFALSSAPVH